MSVVFITGATGYLGSYVVDVLMRETDANVALLTRAKSWEDGVEKLWKALQLHMDADAFFAILPRVRFIAGDLTEPDLGIAPEDRAFLVANAESVLHIAASLNRKSEKACLNQNLRGTLSVIKLAQEIHAGHGLRRFSHVSTVAIAGTRQSETVYEDTALDWDRSDYDPYARTKKFCEHMVRSLVPADVPLTFFRPSIVMGDSRFAETTQFDMIRATFTLFEMPVLPFSGDVRVDIVNADWVGMAIARLHMKERTDHTIYNLSAGTASKTARQLCEAVAAGTGRRIPRFQAKLEAPFAFVMDQLAGSKARNTATLIGSLFKVFLPYITYDTIHDSTRAVTELGVAPVPFSQYGARLYDFVKKHDYSYPYRPLPPIPEDVAFVSRPSTVPASTSVESPVAKRKSSAAPKAKPKPKAKASSAPASKRPTAKRVSAAPKAKKSGKA